MLEMGLLAIGRKMLEKIKNYFYIGSICLTAFGTITGGILYLSEVKAQEIVKKEMVKPMEKLDQELKEQKKQLNGLELNVTKNNERLKAIDEKTDLILNFLQQGRGR
jgi:hypothetical protein